MNKSTGCFRCFPAHPQLGFMSHPIKITSFSFGGNPVVLLKVEFLLQEVHGCSFLFHQTRPNRSDGVPFPDLLRAPSEVPDTAARGELRRTLCRQHVLPRLSRPVLPAALPGLAQGGAGGAVRQTGKAFSGGNVSTLHQRKWIFRQTQT